MMVSRGGTLIALALAGSLTACGGDDEIKTGNYARAIERSVFEQHQQTVKVTCPPTVPKEKGHTFECVVALEVGEYPVKVTEVDDKGGVRYGNDTPLALLDVASVEKAIGDEITNQRKLDSDVTCPKQVLQKAGLTFHCTAEVEGGTTTRFKVEQTDDAGNVTFVGL